MIKPILFASERNRNRDRAKIFQAVLRAIEGDTINRIAKKLGRKPEQIAAMLASSANWDLDTVSDLLYSIDAEMDYTVGATKRPKP